MRIDQQLLTILTSNNDPIPSKKLAFMLGVSEKTVQKYLNYLKEILPEHGALLSTKQRIGTYIDIYDDNLFQAFLLNFHNNSFLDDPVLRKRYVLTLLITSNDYINVYDLADELNVSPTLMRNIFKEAKNTLDTYHLTLEHSHFHGYKISGEESNIRRFLAKECKESAYIQNTLTSSSINNNEKDIIQQIIASTLEQLHIAVSNESINSLTLHILIAINRSETNNPIELKNDFMLLKIKSKPEYFCAKHIFQQIENTLHVVLPENELIYFTLHISGQQRIYGHEQLQVTINESALIFYNRFLRNIWKYADEDFFKDDELRTSLLNHIVPFLTRIQNNMQIEKSELNNIKSEFPYAYDLSVTGLSFLEQDAIHLSEVEISYFALHLQLSLEKRKQQEHLKYNVLVFSEEANSIFHMLSYKINLYFADKINEIVFASSNNINNYFLNDFQIILSTADIQQKLPKETIYISPYMHEEDIFKIRNAFNQLSSRIMNTVMLREYLFFDCDASTKEEIISYAIQQIKQWIRLPSDFYQRIMNREKLASTEYDNRIAIPHPIDMKDIPEFIALIRLKKPILWKNKQVQLVFMICNHGDINPWIYTKLSKMIHSPEISQNLIQAKSFQEFKDIIENI